MPPAAPGMHSHRDPGRSEARGGLPVLSQTENLNIETRRPKTLQDRQLELLRAAWGQRGCDHAKPAPGLRRDEFGGNGWMARHKDGS